MRAREMNLVGMPAGDGDLIGKVRFAGQPGRCILDPRSLEAML